MFINTRGDHVFVLLIPLLLFLPAAAGAQLDVSAFADLVFPATADEESGSQFQVNQAEVDLEGEIAPDVTASMALAYDPAAQGFTLAVLAAEIPLAQDKPLTGALTIGQFDVPFGIDYQVYASLDRKLVTAPLFVGSTHNGWNDLGVNLRLGAGLAGIDLFILNGNSCGRGIVCGDKFITRDEIKRAVGTRVHFVATPGLEIGASGAVFTDVNDVQTMTMSGADLQFCQGCLHVKGEYIAQTTDRTTTGVATHDGFYGQALCEFGSVFAVCRYDSWRPDSPAASHEERLSLGGGYIYRDGMEFRLEHNIGLESLDNVTWLQVVMDFGAVAD